MIDPGPLRRHYDQPPALRRPEGSCTRCGKYRSLYTDDLERLRVCVLCIAAGVDAADPVYEGAPLSEWRIVHERHVVLGRRVVGCPLCGAPELAS